MNQHFRAVAIAYAPHVRRSAQVCAAVAALSLFLYGFFLLEAVAHTASHAQAQSKVQLLTSKMSGLEEAYLSATKDMTPERARLLGFVAPSATAVIYAGPEARALSLRTQ